MSRPAPQANDDLQDFTRDTFTALGSTRPVYRLGSGPGVIIMAEVPGITPRVAGFARQVAEAGFTAVMPDIVGKAGAAPSLSGLAKVAVTVCISREFSIFATGRSSPIVNWLRELAAHEHQRCGGVGVGAIGMCLTGGFALAMMVEPAVIAPVLSQPSLPLGVTAQRKADLGISAPDLAIVKERLDDEDLCVLGLRFSEDPLVPPQRFDRLRHELGERFIAVEIDSSPGNADNYPKDAHSVLTEHLHEPSHAQVIAFFEQQLLEQDDG